MTPRGYLTYFLTLLMGVAPFHCLTHAEECAPHHVQIARLGANRESLPANHAPAPCDNESGCICRGAVLAEPVDSATVAPQGLEMFLELPAPLAIYKVVIAPQDWCYLHSAHRQIPLSGRMLRARLASFVI